MGCSHLRLTAPAFACLLASLVLVGLGAPSVVQSDRVDFEQPWYRPKVLDMTDRRRTYSQWQHSLFIGADPSCGTNLTDPGRHCYWADSRWKPPGNSGYKEYFVGEATACLANKRLVFIGDAVTRETMFALSLLLGFSPFFNYSATDQIWRKDRPDDYFHDHDDVPCKFVKSSAEYCIRSFVVNHVQLDLIFIGHLEPNSLLLFDSMLGPTRTKPHAVFFNYGIWAAVHHGCQNDYYPTMLRGLLGAIRAHYDGPLYWMSNTPKPEDECWLHFFRVASNILGANRITPVDRTYLARGDAGLCPSTSEHRCNASRDNFHYHLPVYTAISQSILNLLCD